MRNNGIVRAAAVRIALIFISLAGIAALASNCGSGLLPEGAPGSIANPILIESAPFTDTRDTSVQGYYDVDAYPPDVRDMGGPGVFYSIVLTQDMTLSAGVDCDAGTDVDLFLLSSLDPLVLIEAANSTINRFLTSGTYYLGVDTLVVTGVEKAGEYTLTCSLSL